MSGNTKDNILESDMYPPICEYLKAQGYNVHSEVKNCDVTAIKGEELIVIEMKRSFNATLLMQATRRQRAADSVYVAIPRPKGRMASKNWNDMCHLLRRLELGLLLVDIRKGGAYVEIAFHPAPYERVKNKRMRGSILREISGRYADYNIGGSTRRKLMTAYRENSIQIACCFEKYGPLSPKQLRELGTGPKTSSILQKNFYGWFERIGKGVYNLHPEAKSCLENYPELAGHYRAELEKSVSNG